MLFLSANNETPQQKVEKILIRLEKEIKLAEKEQHKTVKIVLTYGTFDLFHYGHQNFFDNIVRVCGKKSEIYVGVASDGFNTIKGKKAMDSFEVRCENVKKHPHVVKTFKANNWTEKAKDIQRIKPDIVVTGPDSIQKYDGVRTLCTVICLPKTPGISSTMLKAKIVREQKE